MASSPDRGQLRRDLAATPAGILITCAGISMEPALRPGEKVRVRRVDARELAPGDVFLFERGDGGLELHRLVLAVPGGWLVHRGDNQIVRRFGVTRADRVLGRADLPRIAPSRVERARAMIDVVRRAIRRIR